MNPRSKQIHLANVAKGFWETDNFPEKIALIHSELSEALEADRSDHHANIKDFKMDVLSGNDFFEAFKYHIKNSLEDELADAIIRILDLVGHKNIDIDWHIEMKLKYNQLREYKHGKRY